MAGAPGRSSAAAAIIGVAFDDGTPLAGAGGVAPFRLHCTGN
jgi:hypothetical protein